MDILVEAESWQEAQDKLKSQIPEDSKWVGQKVISKGTQKTVKATADTIEAAFAKAENEIPNHAIILESKEILSAKEETFIVKAFDEQSARTQLKGKTSSPSTILKSLKLLVKGRRGVWRIGKKPDQYEGVVLQQAIVEITYKTKVKILATVMTPDEQRIQEEIDERYSIWIAGDDPSSVYHPDRGF